MAEKQFLDVDGLKTFSDSIKNGSLVAGKATTVEAVAWNGVTDKPKAFTPEAHTHEASEVGIEAIPDATIEAIISGTYNPNE